MMLRDEALLMLEKKGALLETARRVSAILRDAGIDAPIIGGIAVFLHGYQRTTMDVDVFVPESLAAASDALKQAGLRFDKTKRECRAGAVPVQLVDAKLVQPPPKRRSTINDIITVGLADLINIKLTTGTSRVSRAMDIGDVIGLIRANHLTAAFASKLQANLRGEFRKLVKAVKTES